VFILGAFTKLQKATIKGKGKVKVHPRTGQKGPEEEWRYSSTLSLTLALDGVDGQHLASTALTFWSRNFTCKF